MSNADLRDALSPDYIRDIKLGKTYLILEGGKVREMLPFEIIPTDHFEFRAEISTISLKTTDEIAAPRFYGRILLMNVHLKMIWGVVANNDGPKRFISVKAIANDEQRTVSGKTYYDDGESDYSTAGTFGGKNLEKIRSQLRTEDFPSENELPDHIDFEASWQYGFQCIGVGHAPKKSVDLLIPKVSVI